MILDTIVRHKKKELKELKSLRSLTVLKREVSALPKFRASFAAALKKKGPVSVIAEIKRRSPSKGLLCRDFDPVSIAGEYQRSGAAALSVLTDKKFFGGSARILRQVKKTCRLPILRKDFTVDEYQVYEARLIGADAILLIARILSKTALKRFYKLATSLGMDVLFEVHDARELKKILPLKPRLVGINNRDLSDFHVDLNVTEKLAPMIPAGCLIVSESGITGREDLKRLRTAGVRSVLVGETLMRQKSPGTALKRLLGKDHASR